MTVTVMYSCRDPISYTNKLKKLVNYFMMKNLTGFHPVGGWGGGSFPPKHPASPPKGKGKKEKRRERERERGKACTCF